MVIIILIGLAALSIIIIAHELGHFVTAKAVGARVEEFGFGYPPRLLSFTRGETRYSLNVIPFGGFTKITGEEDPKEPESLARKSIGARLLVFSAGSLMNFLLALLLFSITFMIPRDVEIGQVVVEGVAPNSPAAMAGIRPGDIVLSVNDQLARNNSELYQHIMVNLGKETTLLIRHPDSTSESVQVIPRREPPEGEGAIGIIIKTINSTMVIQRYPLWQVIPLGTAKLVETVIMWVDGLVSVFTGEAPALFIGPVGLAQLTGEVAQAGVRYLLEVAALISLILGICNLFPIPALDGGRITFVFLEWVRRGKRVPPKIEGTIHLIGFAMLIVFLLAITYQDIMRIISGESLLP